MRILGKVSFRSLLLLTITFASVGIVAVIITLPTFMVDANHAFALNQNSLLSQQQQKNDNINQDSNITKKFTLIADENVVKISPNNLFHPSGVLYKAMTFNYTIPGPVIAVNQGDTFQITIQNKGQIIHSLDLHGIEGPDQALSGAVQPGESKTWKVKAINAGVFMYHCDGDNLNGIWDHIASGMYGGIVVHSKDERKAAKEFYLVFGEIYNNADKGLFNDITHTNTIIGSFDMAKFVANKPDLILTNGMAYKYMPFFGSQNRIVFNENAELFKVKPGELTRWYIVNAGPRDNIAFNFASGMMNSISYDSDKSIAIRGKNNNTIATPLSKKVYEVSIPPGSAQAIEITFPQEGTYVGNDHDIGRFLIGAGFAVLATNSSAYSDYPMGTRVQS
jgi:nitrite reductase (NO-forming)